MEVLKVKNWSVEEEEEEEEENELSEKNILLG
jgi:hypothetical protein